MVTIQPEKFIIVIMILSIIIILFLNSNYSFQKQFDFASLIISIKELLIGVAGFHNLMRSNFFLFTFTLINTLITRFEHLSFSTMALLLRIFIYFQ